MTKIDNVHHLCEYLAMSQNESISKYGQMSIEARQQLALADPYAAREMALAELITLATEEGYRALEEQMKRDLATVLAKQQAIGASYAADADEMENTEQMLLKAEMPAYARAYFESRQLLQRTFVYSEELPGQVSFGSKFAATIQYPGRAEPTTRKYLLLGPGEASQLKGRFTDEDGEQYTVVSYLSPVGRGFWGASVEDAMQQRITLQLPNIIEPALVLQLDLLGKIS